MPVCTLVWTSESHSSYRKGGAEFFENRFFTLLVGGACLVIDNEHDYI